MKKEVKIPSVVPIYGIGAAVLLYNLLFPMYSLVHLLICAVLAAAVYAVLRKVCPAKTVTVEVPDPAPDTGNAELDAAILQGRRYAEELRRLNDAIPDAALSQDLEEIERLTREIFRQVEQDQSKLTKIRRMMNYYLPTTVKLVRKYADIQGDTSLESVQTMQAEICRMIGSVKAAFRKQLDGLYEHDVIDITADIQVMEQMLAAQGLNDRTASE